MATPYTRRVAKERLSVAGTVQIFLHIGTDVLILRNIVLTNLHSAPQVMGVFLNSQGNNFWLFRTTTAPAGASTSVDLRQELLPGETLHFQTDLGSATCLVTGLFLSNP